MLSAQKPNPEQARQLFIDEVLPHIKGYIDVASKNCPMSVAEKDNMKDSALRVTKAIADIILPADTLISELEHVLSASFPVTDSKLVSKGSDMILTHSPIHSVSLCPHHFLPVQYKVFIAIKIGQGKEVFGLSKYARAVKIIAKRPLIQEQYTRDIVDVFTESTIGGNRTINAGQVSGCFVVVEGQHGCMTCRGIESQSPSITSFSRGFNEADLTTAWNLYNGTKSGN